MQNTAYCPHCGQPLNHEQMQTMLKDALELVEFYSNNKPGVHPNQEGLKKLQTIQEAVARIPDDADPIR